jgi:hypothetical protein
MLFPLVSLSFGWTTVFIFFPFIYLPGIFMTATVLHIFEKIPDNIPAQKMLLKMIIVYTAGCLLSVNRLVWSNDVTIGIDTFINRVIFHNFSSNNMIKIFPEIYNNLEFVSLILFIYFLVLNALFIHKFKDKNENDPIQK